MPPMPRWLSGFLATVPLAVGTRIPLEGVSIAALVRRTGRPVRVDSFARASGPIAEEARALGIRSLVGCPIVVGGRLCDLGGADEHLQARARLARTGGGATARRGAVAVGRRRGVGGAEPARGSGLIGLRDRVESLGGSTQVTSRLGEGTVIAVELPLRPA
jgi:hypothetical protein